jgi:CheY-like chemotaxis protein
MASRARKNILWFEEDAEGVHDHLQALRKVHDVDLGADWGTIQRARTRPVDLVIVDIMIHRRSLKPGSTTGEEVDNVRFPDVDWKRTGVAFLQRLRAGEYAQYGIAQDVPVIVISAVADDKALAGIKEQKPSRIVGKPLSIGDLLETVSTALAGPRG